MKERRKQGKTRTIEKGSEGSRTGGDVINGLECPLLHSTRERERACFPRMANSPLEAGQWGGILVGFCAGDAVSNMTMSYYSLPHCLT